MMSHYRGFHVYQHVTSHSHMRSMPAGKSHKPAKLSVTNADARAYMNDYWAKCTNILDTSARECYSKKLAHGDGISKLPDLYFVQNGW